MENTTSTRICYPEGSPKSVRRSGVQELCRIALFTALIAVCSQFSILLPGGVPMTLQTLIIPIAGIVLGARGGTIATIVYLLLGAVGLPVFAGFSGGLDKLVGMTGGFLISFPLIAWFGGMFSKNNKYLKTVLGITIGSALNYVVGSIMFMALTGMNLKATLAACVIPFIPTAIIKVILAAYLGILLKKTLTKAHLL